MLNNAQSSLIKYYVNNSEGRKRLMSYLESRSPAKKKKQYQYKLDPIEQQKESGVMVCEIHALKNYPHNLGVIADRLFKKGDIIGYYQGEQVHNSTKNTTYLMQTIRGWSINASYLFNWTRCLNDSMFSNNCGFADNKSKQIDKCVKIVALRDIQRGEQLLVNYGDDYSHDRGVVYLYPTDTHLLPKDLSSFNIINKDKVILLPAVFDEPMLETFGLDKNVDQCHLTQLFQKIIKGEKISSDEEKEVNSPSYFLVNGELSEQQNLTPLMFACYMGKASVVSSLLEFDADPLRATLHGGRNSMIFTILGKGNAQAKSNILNELLSKFYKSVNQQNKWFDTLDKMCSFIFFKADSHGKTLADYIVEKDLSSEVYHTINTVALKDGKFPDLYSHLYCFVNFMRGQSNPLNAKLEAIIQPRNFAFSNQEQDSKHSIEHLFQESKEKIQKNNYMIVRNVIKTVINSKDKTSNNKRGRDNVKENISQVIKSACTMLSHRKKIDMYKEVFTCFILENDQDVWNSKQPHELVLDCLKEEKEFSWQDKMSVFYFAFQTVVDWYDPDHNRKSWNATSAFSCLRDKVSADEFDTIYSFMEKECSNQKELTELSKQLIEKRQTCKYMDAKGKIDDIVCDTKKITNKDIKTIKNETGKIIEEVCTILSHEEKVNMYQQVFAHCVLWIKNDQSHRYEAGADALLDCLKKEKEFLGNDKMSVFRFAFLDVVAWHNEDYNGNPWNSTSAFSYLRSKVSADEFDTIYSFIEKECSNQKELIELSKQLTAKRQKCQYKGVQEKINDIIDYTKKITDKDIETIKNKTNKIIQEVCTTLSHKEKVNMYEQVFNHCVWWIENDQSHRYEAGADALLDCLETDISISNSEKVQVFHYVFLQVDYWHNREYEKKFWNSTSAFSYLKNKVITMDNYNDIMKLTTFIKLDKSIGDSVATNHSSLIVDDNTEPRKRKRVCSR